jgi:anti-sigma factor RsiW
MDRLALLVGGDLPPAVAREIEEHLASCESCREEHAAYESARRSLFVLKGAGSGPAPDLWPGIREQLGAPPRRSRVPVRLLATAAAALLVAVLGLRVLNTEAPVEPVKPPPAPSAAVAQSVPAESEYLLEEVTVGGGAAVYDTAPEITMLDTERSEWDEF